MRFRSQRCLGRARVLAVAAIVSCVSYDPAGPPVPSIDGTYAASIVIAYANYIEVRTDTLTGMISLWDGHYRGHFGGLYRVAGDSGTFAGTLNPDGTLSVTDWGTSSEPIAGVGALRQLYPWCDFLRTGAGPLPGELRADSLLVDGGASLPCSYQLFGQVFDIGTQLQLHVVAVR